MKLRKWAGCLLLAAGTLALQAQQQNSPAGDQPAQPQPQQTDQHGAGENGPGSNQNPAAQNTPAPPPIPENVREMIRTAFGLGPPPNPEAAARGQKAFVASCGFCHGTNATGGAQGPNLVRSTLVLHDQGTGKGLLPSFATVAPARACPALQD